MFYQHSLALDSENKLYGWGNNKFNQLSFDGTSDIKVPKLITFNQRILKMAVATSHSMILTEGGQVYSFGSNKYGQLGLGSTKNQKHPTLIEDFENIVSIACGYYHSAAINA